MTTQKAKPTGNHLIRESIRLVGSVTLVISRCRTSELTGLPPVSESIVVLNPFDEKLAGGNSGPTICYAALTALAIRSAKRFRTVVFTLYPLS